VADGGRPSRSGPRHLRPLRDFLHAESAGGYVLVAATVAAIAWANSPWRSGYADLWHTVAAIRVGDHALTLDLRGWVNDGLMTVFFLVVGLEIKRELVDGELRGRARAALPMVSAIGGMVVPAAIFLAFNLGGLGGHGWGVPMATDIAMAVGVLTLSGATANRPLAVYLLALAIVDDIGAILVIAIFYSSGVAFGWLAGAAGLVLALLAAKARRASSVLLYVPIGVALWFALHEAHVHPTIAGVVCGLLAPTQPFLQREMVDADEVAISGLDERLRDVSTVAAARDTVQIARRSVSVVEWLEHVLHPWVTFAIVPLFALANAGVVLSGDAVRGGVHSPVTAGIVAGLVVGKPVGIVLFAWLAVRSGVARLPTGVGWAQVAAIGAVAGIGFTVALFVTELAFTDATIVAEAKLGILVASALSALIGFVALRATSRPTSHPPGVRTGGRSSSSSAGP
jgi:Na+:H+ antiporter, NhaA family